MRYKVKVEFMDGVEREYTSDAAVVRDGILGLNDKDRYVATQVHVASIPLVNVREYKVEEVW